MKCPCCGGADLVREVRDLSFIYKGEETIIPQIEGDFCPSCDEAIFSKGHADRYAETVNSFMRHVNAKYVDPAYIAKVRKQLGLDQRKAGEIFGGGDNAFSRYENGKSKPALALIKLLRVLERHPELLPEVMG